MILNIESDKITFDEARLKEYVKDYSKAAFLAKIPDIAYIPYDISAIDKAWQLYYVAQLPDCPAAIKEACLGALGYLVATDAQLTGCLHTPLAVASPEDFIAAMDAALRLAQDYLTDEIKEQAQEKWHPLCKEWAETQKFMHKLGIIIIP